MSEAFHLNSGKNVAVSNTSKMSKKMSDCPSGVKVLLLGAGGVLVIANYDTDPFWVQWAALPAKDDD